MFIASVADLSRAQRTLSNSLLKFNFECIGTSQTDDEAGISDSLKEFGRLIAHIEDQRDMMVSTTLPRPDQRSLLKARADNVSLSGIQTSARSTSLKYYHQGPDFDDMSSFFPCQ